MEPFPLVHQKLLPVTFAAPSENHHLSGMRVHELALLNFLNRTFLVTEGYPVPVVFATPTDAFSKFKDLFGRTDGPFSYILDLVQADGAEHRPHIGEVFYPLISVERKSWAPRIEQSYGLRRFRPAYYVSVSGSVTRRELANTVGSYMPTGWNYTWNIEHYCRTPETHAIFIEKLMRAFRWSGGSAQTWIPIVFPGFYGHDHKLVRLYLSGDIQDLSEPTDQNINEFRTGFTLVMEGYNIDQSREVVPALWTKVTRFQDAVDPNDVQTIFSISEDLRDTGTNVVFNERTNLPKA